MDKRYDLHTHSYCSDGKLAPAALVQLAHEQGVEVLALTDHDTLEGVAEAKLEAERLSALANDHEDKSAIQIVTGIEFSCEWRGRNIHIVGLCVDLSAEALIDVVAQQTQARHTRAQDIAKRLAKAGIAMTWEQVWEGASQFSKNGHLCRPHFAQYLVESGHVSSIKQAFQKYLGSGKIGDVKQHWPSVEAVVECINQAQGIAVLAHPNKYDLTRTKLYELVSLFTEAGGQAIEIVSGNQNKNITEKLMRLADDFALWSSCGSDFHSPDNGWQMVGKMAPVPSNSRGVWELPQFTL